MATSALPPGFYEIHIHSADNLEKEKILTPQSLGVSITSGTGSADATASPILHYVFDLWFSFPSFKILFYTQWQISGDGLIVAFDKSNWSEYQTRTNNSPCQAGDYVTTGKIGGMRWIIYEAQWNLGDYWTAYIMSNDGTKLFWTINPSNSCVWLRQFDDICILNIPKFHFVPVGPRDGRPLSELPGWQRKFRVENPNHSTGIGILEAIMTLIIVNLYVIMQLCRGNHAGELTELLPPWLKK
ncbi:hypothetical protein F5876DRAFT_80761 [Lentinula aff. lateritia]|uniref:Uncharacterized protein n=1 Tax=Lentinula aff. lateritia TaxID=2804960 RepID=A0ACC1TP39_9AGAR|nr:hypothetical protein F5876DRAFT_80761 [Lentinula aff. lateritia]